MWIKKAFLLIAVASMTILLSNSCRSKKNIGKSVSNHGTNKGLGESAVKSFELNNLNFLTFSGRAKAKVRLENKEHDATAHIRIENNKAIWISVTATIFNVEVARVLITPSTIKIMNRLQAEVIEKPFSYIYQYTNPGVSFTTLQAILVGNLSPELLYTDNIEVASSEDEVVISGSKNTLKFQYGMNEIKRPSAFQLQDVGVNQKLAAGYNNHNNIDGHIFPQTFDLNVRGSEVQLYANLQYNKIEFDKPLEIPFNVPSNYRVIR